MTIDFSIIGKVLLACALCALPADKRTKRPLTEWKAYQDNLPTEADWDRWGSTTTAICILAGKISGYLLIIDFDDKGSRFEPWCQLIPQELLTRLIVIQTPSGGYHVYFRYECEGEPIGNVKLARKKVAPKNTQTLIETRGEGGVAIAPPTPGYTKLSGSFKSIPVLSRDELELLLDAARSLDEMPKYEPKATTITSSIDMSGVDAAEVVQRAIAYIAKMPEAIQGFNGSADTLRVCNKLYEFGLDRDTAKHIIMKYYNYRCKPEWSEKEIDQKLDTAYNKPLSEAGCSLNHAQ